MADFDFTVPTSRPVPDVNAAIDTESRLLPIFDIWKRLGTREHMHPWMEVVLPWSTAAEYLDAVLPDLSPGIKVGGHVLLWPGRCSVSEVPLFMHAQEEYLTSGPSPRSSASTIRTAA
jgi:hypothetical protein